MSSFRKLNTKNGSLRGCVLYIVLVGMVSVVGIQVTQGETPTMVVSKCDDFQLDGLGNADAWKHVVWTELSRRDGASHDYTTRIKTLYSDTGLYVFFEGSDSFLTATMEEDFLDLWTEDVFECFLWPSEAHTIYFEYELSPLGYELPILVPNLDGRFLGWRPWHYEGNRKVRKVIKINRLESAQGEQIVGWSAEIFIPFALLEPMHNVPPKSGTRWRANFYRVDYDHHKSTAWDWARVGPSFHEFKKFGTLQFQ